MFFFFGVLNCKVNLFFGVVLIIILFVVLVLNFCIIFILSNLLYFFMVLIGVIFNFSNKVVMKIVFLMIF